MHAASVFALAPASTNISPHPLRVAHHTAPHRTKPSRAALQRAARVDAGKCAYKRSFRPLSGVTHTMRGGGDALRTKRLSHRRAGGDKNPIRQKCAFRNQPWGVKFSRRPPRAPVYPREMASPSREGVQSKDACYRRLACDPTANMPILRVNAPVQAGNSYSQNSTLTTLRSTARHLAPSDRTSVPRPPHTSALGVPGDTTADESQLRERGA